MIKLREVMDFVIIILNWNKPNLTINTVKSIKINSNLSTKIVIADNGSDDNSTEIFEKETKAEILKLDCNYGYAKGYNLAVKHVLLKYDPEYLLLLNNDTELYPDTLMAFYDKRESADIITPKIYYNNKTTLWSCGGKINSWRSLAINKGIGEEDRGQYEEFVKTDFATGCAIWVKSEVVKSISLFDENYEYYYEDVDFSFRANKIGYKVYYLPSAKVVHMVGQSAGDEYEKFQSYYRWRNRFIFSRKNANTIQYLWFVMILPLIILRDIVKYINRNKFTSVGYAFKGLFNMTKGSSVK